MKKAISTRSVNRIENTTGSSTIKIGIVGLSVHTKAFTEILNSHESGDYFDCKVTAFYQPGENKDVAFSKEDVTGFRKTMDDFKVEEVSSLDELIDVSHAVMVLTNDGRPHLSEVLPILKAGKKIFLDKPVADNWSNVRKIYKASKDYNVPIFSSSALRYSNTIQNVLSTGVLGAIEGADTFGPAPLQSSHVDLFWDGIHGIEMLYTVMGTGCQSVTQVSTEGCDLVVGKWQANGIGIFRGIRVGKSNFGGTVYGSKSIASLGSFDGYEMLVKKIAEFFTSGQLPVPVEETLEIYAFMDAAYRSKIRGGKEVKLRSN